MNVEVPAKSRRTNTPRVNRGECGMVVYGKGRLEKLESCPISAAYVEMRNLYSYTRYIPRGAGFRGAVGPLSKNFGLIITQNRNGYLGIVGFRFLQTITLSNSSSYHSPFYLCNAFQHFLPKRTQPQSNNPFFDISIIKLVFLRTKNCSNITSVLWLPTQT